MRKKITFVFVTFFALSLLIFASLEVLLRIKYNDFESVDAFERSLGHFVPLRKIIPTCEWADTLYPHPYLGVIHGGNQLCKEPNLNNIGTVGPDFPENNDEKYFDILITGGSVAYNMFVKHVDRIGYLKPYLEENFTDANGRKIRVFGGAIGSWKQPQQLIFHTLHGDNFDGILSLEGANEFSNALNYKLAMPFGIVFKYIHLPDVQMYSAVFFTASADLFRRIFSFSYFTRLVSVRVNQYFNRMQFLKFEESFLFKTFFVNNIKDEEDGIKKKADEYLSYLKKFNHQANSLNQKFIIFLQPILANFKSKHENEKSIPTSGMHVDKYYAKGVEHIKAQELDYVADLTRIFETNNEDIYFDYIHFKYNEKPYSKGHRIISEKIGEILIKKWNLKKVDHLEATL